MAVRRSACVLLVALTLVSCSRRVDGPSAEALRRSACRAALTHDIDQAVRLGNRAAALQNSLIPLLTDLMNAKFSRRFDKMEESVTFYAGCRSEIEQREQGG
jgi:hypothetical protein